MKLTFAGAAGTVTGSRYVLDHEKHRLLIDCGLFQGYKVLRLRNRAPFPVKPETIDAAILTHAHLDHSGYLPVLVRDGFSAPVYASLATRDLCAILLPDSGHLQEEEAKFLNRHALSKHDPALPLYTKAEALASLAAIKGVKMDTEWEVLPGMRATLRPAGHLLGASMVEVKTGHGNIVFSGDLGRPHDSIMPPPTTIPRADYLVLESTYGNRRHEAIDPETQFGDIIKKTAARGGIIVVPSFAVGRAQALMYAIHRLKARKAIPDLPVFLNSPMAMNATELYRRHAASHRLDAEQCRGMCKAATIVNSVEESQALNDLKMPAVIIAASGMATGGRVLHHLIAYASDEKNSIVLTGYQAGGTRGAAIAAGADEIKIFGRKVPIRAEVHQINGYSAHADADEIIQWLKGFETPPRRVFITHGEPEAADSLRKRIGEELHWNAHVPDHLETVSLDFGGVKNPR